MAGTVGGKRSSGVAWWQKLPQALQQQVSAHFYNKQEAAALPEGAKLMVADNNRQWASARVIGHSNGSVKVQWVGSGWGHLTYEVEHSDTFSLSKCSTPSLANKMAADVNQAIQQHKKPAKAKRVKTSSTEQQQQQAMEEASSSDDDDDVPFGQLNMYVKSADVASTDRTAHYYSEGMQLVLSTLLCACLPSALVILSFQHTTLAILLSVWIHVVYLC